MFAFDFFGLLEAPLFQIMLTAVLLLVFLKSFKSINHRFFVWVYTTIIGYYTPIVLEHKKLLFAPLRDFQSLNKSLREQGVFRLLEIGVGPAVNFSFYPKNARVVVVDPNPHFERLVNDAAKCTDTHLERFVVGEGENLKEFQDGSMDVVVMTAVLCSVRDAAATLREIHRVLAPGGLYVFMEHVRWTESDGGGWYRYLFTQKFVRIIWAYVFGGCQVTKDSGQAILQAGFQNTKLNRLVLTKLTKMLMVIVGPHVWGAAQK